MGKVKVNQPENQGREFRQCREPTGFGGCEVVVAAIYLPVGLNSPASTWKGEGDCEPDGTGFDECHDQEVRR